MTGSTVFAWEYIFEGIWMHILEMATGHVQEDVKVFVHEPGQFWQHSLPNVAVGPGKYEYIPIEYVLMSSPAWVNSVSVRFSHNTALTDTAHRTFVLKCTCFFQEVHKETIAWIQRCLTFGYTVHGLANQTARSKLPFGQM